MSNGKQKIPWLGIALIVFGAAILLRKFHFIELEYWSIFWPLLMLMGLVIAGRGFSANRHGKIFWGTVLFLFSLFFLLRAGDIMDVSAYLFPPSVFLIIGLAFLMLFLNNVREWYFLLLASVFGGIGSLLLLANYGYLYYWDVWELLRTYWPVVLIFLGVGLLLKRRPRSVPPV
ncbi:MAG TPA: DUF5668 domain-containing protein [Bacteroidota bacterium]|nr:DUF5668 domain-containing protein [Bacteroidota bacterium]